MYFVYFLYVFSLFIEVFSKISSLNLQSFSYHVLTAHSANKKDGMTSHSLARKKGHNT